MKNNGLLLLLVWLFASACDSPQNPVNESKPCKDSVNVITDTKFDTIWYPGMMTRQDENSDSIIYIKTWEGIAGDSVRIVSADFESTLRLYAANERIRLAYWHGVIETGTINKIKYGFIAAGYGLDIYRLDQNGCKLIRSLNLEVTVIGGGLPHWRLYQVGDLNFDGYDDVAVEVPTFGAHGNSEYTLLLFDPATETFYPARGNVIENLSVDGKNKILHGKHFSSVCGCSCKMLYRVIDDSIVCMEKIKVHSACNGIDQDSANFEHWKYTGTIVSCDSARLPTNKAWRKFAKTLWDNRKTWVKDHEDSLYLKAL